MRQHEAVDPLRAAAEPDTRSHPPGSADWWRERRAARLRRRPRAGGLTIEQITGVALRIVDDEGLDALTMRRLAAALRTGAASLYRHVANREELLVEVVDRVFGEFEFGPPAAGWDADFRHQTHALRAALLAHSRLLPVVLRTPLIGPNAIRGREDCLRRLLDYGFGPDDVQPIYTVLVTTVLGQVVFAAQRPDEPSDRPEPLRAEVFADQPADVYPTVVALAELTSPHTSSDLFSLTINLVLDGIDARYPRR
jgi:AcrR family transcriptional regulator